MNCNIQITTDTARTIVKLQERYFFGLFQEVSTSEEEEYQLRDALDDLAKQIKRGK